MAVGAPFGPAGAAIRVLRTDAAIAAVLATGIAAILALQVISC